MIAIPENYKPISKKHWATFILPVILGIFGLLLLFHSWVLLNLFGIILIIISIATIYTLATISTKIDYCHICISKGIFSSKKSRFQIPVTITAE